MSSRFKNCLEMKRVWNYFIRSTNIYESFLPFSNVLWLFGFMSLTPRRQAETTMITTLLDRFLIGFWVFLYVLQIALISLWGQQEPETEKSLLIKHGWHKLYIFELFFLVWAIRLNFIHRFSINEECLRLIDQFDLVEVKREECQLTNLLTFSYPQTFQSKVNHSRHRSIVVGLLFISLLFSSMSVVASYFILEPDQREPVHVMSIVCYALGTALMALVAYQFVFFIFSIQQRLVVFTENLLTAFPSHSSEKLVDNFSQQYSILSSAMRKINDTLSIQVSNINIVKL